MAASFLTLLYKYAEVKSVGNLTDYFLALHGFEFLLCNFELVWSQPQRLGLCVWRLLWWSASPRDLAGMIGRFEASNVRFGVVDPTESTCAVGSVVKKHMVVLTDSPAADIKVLSSVNVALSVTRLVASAIVLPTRCICTSRVAANSLKWHFMTMSWMLPGSWAGVSPFCSGPSGEKFAMSLSVDW